ncbi:Glycosyltransferase involved in cell wall bisynthesis [Pseudidiomarina planktonica]|uniref:Glycosyltransferase involved in cell wall bisynthesis n=1 Tax=Pseudidiomarina planktonica TaxID=1323738 RepID=A0A1Y6EGH1_9GAMM|nr:glycosyltransferase [Pseudidiomarina planktonica]RUO65935.1 glycosyltransferase [Pseudidiomarina planktonica]SMQ61697.1 Glycosyltransferase involved in cell wall bisynthesis [Pseudidiomarina planktonica]
MKTKHIVFVLPSLHGGGAEGVVVRLSHGLLNRGYKVSILTLESRQQYIIDDQIEVKTLSSLEGQANKFLKLLSSFMQLFNLIRYIKKNDACYIGFLERPILYVGFARLFLKFPCIASFRNHTSSHLMSGRDSFWGRRFAFIYRRLLATSSRKFDHLDFLSKAARMDFDENFFDTSAKAQKDFNVSVIYNGYNVSKMSVKATKYSAFPLLDDLMVRKPCLVSVGRIEQQKGHLNFLHVLAGLKAENLDATYVVVGDGALKEELVSLSRKLSLELVDLTRCTSGNLNHADVIVTGFVENPFAILSRAKYFVFPSLWEGFGNALVEALCVGTPVLSSDCPVGPREILDIPLDRKVEEKVTGAGGFLLPLLPNEKWDDFDKIKRIWTEGVSDALRLEKEEYSALRQDAVQRAAFFSEPKQLDAWEEIIKALPDSRLRSKY